MRAGAECDMQRPQGTDAIFGIRSFAGEYKLPGRVAGEVTERFQLGHGAGIGTSQDIAFVLNLTGFTW